MTLSDGPSKKRELVSLSKAGDYAGVNRLTIRRFISRGVLTGYRVANGPIRVDLNEVDGLIRVMPAAETA